MRVRTLLLALFAAACQSDQSGIVTGPQGLLTPGTWGGANSEIDVGSSDTRISIGCQSGTFPAHINIVGQGMFTADGTWNISVGPVLLNGDMPAQVSGQVIGSNVSFAVAVYDTTNKRVIALGPETATYGHQSGSIICPVN